MQLMQHQNGSNQHAICLQAPPECITFHINNPVKIITGNHVNLYISTIGVSIYTDSIV